MSGIELKTVNPVVFDDPVYCRDKGTYDYCEYLEIVSHDCHDDEAICNLFPESDDLVFNSGKWEKCQQCKDHLKRTKETTCESCALEPELDTGACHYPNSETYIDNCSRHPYNEDRFKPLSKE